jgi:hypothetical protein
MPADSLVRLAVHIDEPIATAPPARDHLPAGPAGDQLFALLSLFNGGYAFHGALHVFPDDPSAEVGLAAWNSATGWRAEYPAIEADAFFFAEDVFGVQFAILGEAVVAFDPETGAVHPVAYDIEDWAEGVLGDGGMLSGWPVAREWTAANGPLPPGTRLVPKVPFVAGGDYSVSNLYVADAITAMWTRAPSGREAGDDGPV